MSNFTTRKEEVERIARNLRARNKMLGWYRKQVSRKGRDLDARLKLPIRE